MRALCEACGGELVWWQSHALRREDELRADGEVVATLRWRQGGSLALAETADGRWTFKRRGFWRPHVTARVEGSDRDVAVFEPTCHGAGTLTLTGGGRFRWGAAGFWQSQWAWQDESGAALITFSNKPDLTSPGSRVAVAPGAVALPGLPLLATLGWYLLALHAQEAVVATAAVAVTSARGAV